VRFKVSPEKVRQAGLEPITAASEVPENLKNSELGAAKASPTLFPPMVADDDLRAVVEAWPIIPPAIRAGILAMVKDS
jgi:hypothetical protein